MSTTRERMTSNAKFKELRLNRPARAMFWLEQLDNVYWMPEPPVRGRKNKSRRFVEKDVWQVRYWLDTLVGHNEEVVFSFDDGRFNKKGKLLIAFSGDTPFVDQNREPVYAFTVGARYALRDYNDPSRSKTAGNLKIAYIPSLDGNVAGYNLQIEFGDFLTA
jgi:hypothetical protein